MNPCRDFGTPILLSDSERTKDKKITDLFRRVNNLENLCGALNIEIQRLELEVAQARYEKFLLKAKEVIDDKGREEKNNS